MSSDDELQHSSLTVDLLRKMNERVHQRRERREAERTISQVEIKLPELQELEDTSQVGVA